MPRLNEDGVPTDGHQVHWFDRTRAIRQVCDGGVCRLMLSDGTEVAKRGVTDLVASGNGHWAAFLDGYGVFDSYGQHFPESSISGTSMSPSGVYARKVKYHSYGPWVLQGARSQALLVGGDLERGYVHLSGAADAVWTEGGRLRSNVAVKDPGRLMWWPVLVGDMLLCQEQQQGRLVLDGHVIMPPGNYFYLDGRVLIDGRVVISWSPNQGDTQPFARPYTRAEVNALPLLGDEPPPPPPPPETTSMLMPRAFYDTYVQVANKFADLRKGDDDQRREMNMRAVATIRKRHGAAAERVVCKTEHSNGWVAQSKDTVGYVRSGPVEHGRLAPMLYADMVNGGTREVNKYPLNFEEDLRNPDAYILIPEAKDWLEGYEPPPPPPPSDDDSVAKLREDLDDAVKRMQRMDDALIATNNTVTGSLADIKEKLDKLQANLDALSRRVDGIKIGDLDLSQVELSPVRRTDVLIGGSHTHTLQRKKTKKTTAEDKEKR